MYLLDYPEELETTGSRNSPTGIHKGQAFPHLLMFSLRIHFGADKREKLFTNQKFRAFPDIVKLFLKKEIDRWL